MKTAGPGRLTRIISHGIREKKHCTENLRECKNLGQCLRAACHWPRVQPGPQGPSRRRHGPRTPSPSPSSRTGRSPWLRAVTLTVTVTMIFRVRFRVASSAEFSQKTNVNRISRPAAGSGRQVLLHAETRPILCLLGAITFDGPEIFAVYE